MNEFIKWSINTVNNK